MKSLLLVFITILIIAVTMFIDLKPDSETVTGKYYTLVIHGGAGTINKDLPDSLKQIYFSTMTEALNIGKEILEAGGSALDAVERVVIYLENHPQYNAGRGAVLTSDGTFELDASIMDGSNLSSGAVACVKTVKNPISLARLVMEKTEHVLFAGSGADELAKQFAVEIVDQDYYKDERRMKQFENMKKGTVGAVALDMNGNIAAATSTGGRMGKTPGRVGDSPIIGAGNYANNKTCGVSGTGVGELFIKYQIAFNISALMEYKNFSLADAVNEILHKQLEPNTGGIIAIDKNGNHVIDFNTSGMPSGVANSDGLFEIKIWK